MSQIDIPFNEWSIEKLTAGIKRATTRTKKYGEPGDIFPVKLNNGLTATYQLDFVVQLPLWFIARYLHKTEGADIQKEFEDVWHGIHSRKKWTGHELLWYHYFKVRWGVFE